MRNALRRRTTRQWERARQEQKLHQCRSAENALTTGIRDWNALIDSETRCNMETEMFLIIKTDSLKSDSVKWMNKYEEDYDAVEVDIQVCTDQLAELRNKWADLKAISDKRQARMDKYLNAKAAAEAERKWLILAQRAAVQIQAWWRGTMVRKRLGPFRRKKRKKGKGKGGKAKTKKY